jgi:2TM domain
MEIIPNPDDKLWRIAKKRASFKRNVFNWIVINAFLWFIWAIGDRHDAMGIPWPVWPTVGWALGLIFQFLGAYGGDTKSLEEKEFENLKRGGK